MTSSEKSKIYWQVVEDYIKIRKTNNAFYHESILELFNLYESGSSNIKHAINQTLICLLGTSIEGIKFTSNDGDTQKVVLKPIPEYDQKMKELNDKIELLTEINQDLSDSFWRVKEERDNLKLKLNQSKYRSR